MKCPDCQRDFPDELIIQGTFNDPVRGHRTESACPICQLRKRNEMHGLPADTPFNGPMAADLHRRAIAHLTFSGQSS